MTTNSSTAADVTLQSGMIQGTTGVLTSATTYVAQSGTISASLGGTGIGLTDERQCNSKRRQHLYGADKITAGTLTDGGATALSDSAVNLANSRRVYRSISAPMPRSDRSQAAVRAGAVSLSAPTRSLSATTIRQHFLLRQHYRNQRRGDQDRHRHSVPGKRQQLLQGRRLISQGEHQPAGQVQSGGHCQPQFRNPKRFLRLRGSNGLYRMA